MNTGTLIGSCKDCKWWREDKHSLAPDPQKECRNAEFLHESGLPGSGDPAESLTYEYYEGGQIWTGPEFGCVHFKSNTCLRCDGEGRIVKHVTYEGPWYEDCPECDGSGKRKETLLSVEAGKGK